MKSILIMVASAAAALLVSGCNTTRDEVVLNTGRALLVAEYAVDGANTAATVAANSGRCTSSCAVNVKNALSKANTGLNLAEQAWATRDVASATHQTQLVLEDVAHAAEQLK